MITKEKAKFNEALVNIIFFNINFLKNLFIFLIKKLSNKIKII